MIKTFKDTVVRLIRKEIKSSIQTSYPAVIKDVSKYEQEQVVTVKPLIQIEYEDGEVVELPNIYDVPVVLPSAKGCLISVPLKKGDVVALQFVKNSLEEFVEASEVFPYNPVDNRFFALTDCLAYPCVWTRSNNLHPHPDNLEIKLNDALISQHPDGTIIVKNKKVTTTYSPDGEVVTDNGTVSSTYGSDGSATVTNGTGSFKLLASGNLDLNGVVITPTGVMTVPVSITAPTVAGTTSVSGASISATTSLKVAGKEQSGHKHLPGEYVAPQGPVTGNSGEPV